MKKRLWIAAGVILAAALACGVYVWQETQAINREMAQLLDLPRILILAENRGADWATDELMIAHVDARRKESLYQKWGEPDIHKEAAKEDRWILSDEFQLVVAYDERERIEHVKVIAGT